MDSADDSSGSTEGCDDVDDLDDDDDDVLAVTGLASDRRPTSYDQQQLQQTDSDGRSDSEMSQLTNINRECAVFMADFVKKIFDPS